MQFKLRVCLVPTVLAVLFMIAYVTVELKPLQRFIASPKLFGSSSPASVPLKKYLQRNSETTVADNTSSHFRGLYESHRLLSFCRNVNKTIVSDTSPPFYPFEGTGTPANVSDEEFDTSHFRKFCSSSMPAIVIAYSAAPNFDRRKAIRDTIGKQCEKYNCKLLFIVGISLDKEIAASVKAEYTELKDIFIKDKIDTYADLNNKVVAMLDWLLEFCQQPKYIIHIVDDTFANVKLYLLGLSNVNETRFAYGNIHSKASPLRHNKSKYYVPPKQYPATRYPDFINGIAYAFPNSLTQELRCAIHKAKYVWLEDAWLLGEIRTYLGGFKLIQSEFRSWNRQSSPNINVVPKLLCVHYATVMDFYRFNSSLS